MALARTLTGNMRELLGYCEKVARRERDSIKPPPSEYVRYIRVYVRMFTHIRIPSLSVRAAYKYDGTRLDGVSGHASAFGLRCTAEQDTRARYLVPRQCAMYRIS